ncbi:MAG TPA: hypothetical protein VFA12_17885 [Stellaceae bacterium]|nr:hypothetical protein [Stellaceae bacterium]
MQLTLGGVCLALLALIGAELAWLGPAPVDAIGTDRSGSPATPRPVFTMPPPAAFAEVVARPLFSPDRRPGARAEGLPASSAFRLVAIVVSGQDRHALLGVGQPMKVVRVREGQEVGGWTVEAIQPDKVIVRRADLREEVKASPPGRPSAAPAQMVVSAPAETKGPPRHRPAHDE